MHVNELKRVKELEEENSWLKRIYADLSLVKDAQKQVLEKKVRGPVNRRAVAVSMVVEHRISVVQASKTTGVARSTIAYKPNPNDDSIRIGQLGALVERHPGIGFDKAYHQTRLQGKDVNKKKLYRIYTALGLNIRRRKRKRLPARVKQALFVPEAQNYVWSMDFMYDSFWSGKAFRVLKIVDNGPELISIKLDLWCREIGVTLAFIQLSKPTQNVFIERFNRTVRTEVLKSYVFKSIHEVRERMDEFILDYNHHRPHEVLGNRSPVQHQTINQTYSLQLTEN